MQIKKLRALKSTRDNKKAAGALKKVETSAREGGNLMYPVLGAVESYATLGEIADVMRGVFGEY